MKYELQQFLKDSYTYDGNECRLWPYSVTGKRGATRREGGYGQVRLADGRRYLVHNLICEHIHGPRPTPKHQAAHSCGIQHCVAPRHLNWKTGKENQRDKHAHGTIPDQKGEKNPRAILSDKDVAEIKAVLLVGGPPGFQNRLAEKYGVNKVYISAIKHGRKWIHVQP